MNREITKYFPLGAEEEEGRNVFKHAIVDVIKNFQQQISSSFSYYVSLQQYIENTYLSTKIDEMVGYFARRVKLNFLVRQ